MTRIERLGADHASAVLDFELTNRGYFAATIGDRGDDWFAHFADRHRSLLEAQTAGTDHFHVLVEPDGSVVGRVNLFEVADGSAEVGYRIAEHATGRGLATAAVRRVVALAASYGLRTLRAGTNVANVASQRVLEKAGFTEVTRFDDQVRYVLEIPDTVCREGDLGSEL